MRRVPVCLVLLMLLAGICFPSFAQEIIPAHYLRDSAGKQIQKAGKLGGGPVILANNYRAKQDEMRGIWVATVYNIDFDTCKTAAQFRAAYTAMINRLQAAGFNTVFFQVRPQNDAFYASAFNPYSRYLTGTEGVGIPGFDPLEYMLTETHRRGMKFHAWLNPYRVAQLPAGSKQTKTAYLNTLASNNFARKKPDAVLMVEGESGPLLILDPGNPEVRSFVANTVYELVTHYNVDGVVFDDYFYPKDMPTSADYSSWRKYRVGNTPIADWRRSNTENLIRSVQAVIRNCNASYKRNIKFGISPFGVWANKSAAHPEGSLTNAAEAYTQQFYDVRKWIKLNLIDYVSPQIYWGFTHATAPYATLAEWWANAVSGTKVKLYVSHAVYRVGVQADMISSSSLADQLLYNSIETYIGGSIFYSYRKFFAGDNNAMKAGSRYIVEQFWKKKYTP